MYNDKIRFMPQSDDIFSADHVTDREETVLSRRPINGYCGYIDPTLDVRAVAAGRLCAGDIENNKIADFERNLAYCAAHGTAEPDRMVHVSTFKIISGTVYMTYYANVGTDAEDPTKQETRIAFCPMDAPEDMTVVTIQKAGDTLAGKLVDRVYDTILLYKGGNELYILWTASIDGLYYRLYCTYNMNTFTFSEIRPNRFKVGNTVNDFSANGMASAVTEYGHPLKERYSDIGIMQKLSAREENGSVYYYTGAYSGDYTCIIKSRDFITWEYVSAPDFDNMSQWENATYVWGDKAFYFVRQQDCMQGFLTYCDLNTGKWAKPFLVRDAQSRPDFFAYDGKLYLVNAPKDRNGFGIVRVDTENIADSKPVLTVDMKSSLFYPYIDVIDDEAFISYTVNRKHIRLSHFDLKKYLK